MRLPVLRLAAVEIAFLLEMLEKLPLFLRFYPHLRRQIFKVGNQARHGRRVLRAFSTVLRTAGLSTASYGLIGAHAPSNPKVAAITKIFPVFTLTCPNTAGRIPIDKSTV